MLGFHKVETTKQIFQKKNKILLGWIRLNIISQIVLDMTGILGLSFIVIFCVSLGV